MISAEALRQFFSVQTFLGVQTAALILLVVRVWNGSPAMFAQWLAYRRAKAEEKHADFNRLREEITRLDASAKESRQAEARCNDELLDVKKRLAVVEGYQIGRGQAAQDVAILQGGSRLGGNGDGA